MTRIAIFSDTDLNLHSDLTTALKAVLRSQAPDLHARILTASDLATDTEEYFAAASVGVTLPWDRQQRVFWPRVRPFAREIRAAGIDVIHIATAGPVGLAGRWLARRTGLPVVGSVHASVPAASDPTRVPPRVAQLLERLSRWAYDGCEPILVPSRAVQASLANRGFARLQVWNGGVDTSCFAPGRSSSTLREAWHVDHRRPAILVPLHRLTRAEAALIELVRRRLDRHAMAHQFVFVGPHPPKIDLEAICPEGIFVNANDLSEDHLAVVMASCDLCLFLGSMDVAAATVLEAQASGLPVIVPNAGGAMEQILAGHTGWLARAGDVDDIVTCITKLLRSAGLRADIGRAGRAHALDRDWPTMLKPLHAAWRTAGQRRGITSQRVPLTTNEAA